MTEKAELVVREELAPDVLRPVGSVEQILQAWQMFQELKRAIITEEDYYLDERGKPQLKIGGWRKLAIAYGLTTELLSEDRLADNVDPREWVARVVLRVRARGGRVATGIGYFSTREIKHKYLEDNSVVHPTKTDKSGAPIPVPLEHITTTRAYTRALKRAVQDMIGPVEHEDEDLEEPDKPSPPPQAPQPGSVKPPVQPGQQRVDAGQRAVVIRFLEEILAEDLMQRIRIEEDEDVLRVVLPRPYTEDQAKRFTKAMWSIGQGLSESSIGLVARMKAPSNP